MTLPRRRFLQLATGAAALPILPRVAGAQAYPARNVRIIVPVAPGGALDILARLMGQWLSEKLGQTVCHREPAGRRHQYRHRGGGALARRRLHAAPHSRVGDHQRHALREAQLQLHPRHHASRDDQQPAAGDDGQPCVPAKTVAEFIAWAKANPGKISMASGGSGSASHVGGELFKMLTGVDMQHVPYRGGAPAITDLIGGQVQVYFSPLPECIETIKAGKVRALAVTTATRVDALPDLPTISETVKGCEFDTWQGIGAPKGTPADIVERLNKEINAALADAEDQGATGRARQRAEAAVAGGVREADRRRDREVGESDPRGAHHAAGRAVSGPPVLDLWRASKPKIVGWHQSSSGRLILRPA